LILLTTDECPGRTVERVIGLVRGNTVRGSHAGRDVSAWLKNFVGGEVEEYTKLLAEAREQALDRMLEEARARGADAVIGVRFTTCEISDGAAEFLVYGTAVKLAPRESGDFVHFTFGIIVDYDDPERITTLDSDEQGSDRFPLAAGESRRWVWDRTLDRGRYGIRGYFNVDTTARQVISIGQ